MAGRRWVGRILGTLLAMVAVTSACSSVEDDLRAELRESGVSDEAIDCVFDAFDTAGIDLNDLSGSNPAPSAAAEAAMAPCMEQLFGEMFAGLEDDFSELAPGTIAFDATDVAPVELGPLVDACQNGDNAACDELWLHSAFDSPEEQIAESCGGRSSEPRMGLCSFHLD